jgi:hypothetical protein
MGRRVAVTIVVLGLLLSGFALGGCGSSERRSGTTPTQFGSVIFRLRSALTTNDVTRVDVSTRGATTVYRLFIHGKQYDFACTTSCTGVSTQTAYP